MKALWTVAEAAQACGGSVTGPDTGLTGFSTDSRAVKPGDLFVALRGERFDAHDFIADVQAVGAAAIVVAHDCPHAAGTLIRVADTRIALGDIARAWRSRFELPLIGVTGSNGKTTVKEMIAAILRTHALSVGWNPDTTVLATRGNLNNDIGVPLMLFGLRNTHRLAVIEMGMNHPGEIAWLAGMAKPTVALVNNAQREHLEFMNSVAEVARENGDVFDALGADGVAVINADDDFADYWAGRNTGHHTLRFGISPGADVGATATPVGLGYRLDLLGVFGTAQIMLRVPGLHNARNALCAATASLAAGADMAAVVWALNQLRRRQGTAADPCRRGRQHHHRRQLQREPGFGARRHRRAGHRPAGRRVLVLGDMGEVGNEGPAFHREAVPTRARHGIHALHALGEASDPCSRRLRRRRHHYTDHAAIAAALRPQLDADTTVLVKGSRFMRMERVAEALLNTSGRDTHAS
jgi:UDP-N-acetylmuramoyl-tripeptide--D-alanyl-D-alanine ligase